MSVFLTFARVPPYMPFYLPLRACLVVPCARTHFFLHTMPRDVVSIGSRSTQKNKQKSRDGPRKRLTHYHGGTLLVNVCFFVRCIAGRRTQLGLHSSIPAQETREYLDMFILINHSIFHTKTLFKNFQLNHNLKIFEYL